MSSVIMHNYMCSFALHIAGRLNRIIASCVRKHLGAHMAKHKGVWCLGVACPWCILQAEHGDYEQGHRD